MELQQVDTTLSDMPEGWIVLLETNVDSSLDLSVSTIKNLTEKDYIGIVVSASRPYNNLIKMYESKGIDLDKLFVLDCVSKELNKGITAEGNVLFLQNVSSLTEISIAINKSITAIPAKKFIFIDSITTMLIHNDPSVYVRFIHSILTKLRIHGVNGLMISLKGETNKEVRAEISQLCDKVVSV